MVQILCPVRQTATKDVVWWQNWIEGIHSLHNEYRFGTLHVEASAEDVLQRRKFLQKSFPFQPLPDLQQTMNELKRRKPFDQLTITQTEHPHGMNARLYSLENADITNVYVELGEIFDGWLSKEEANNPIRPFENKISYAFKALKGAWCKRRPVTTYFG